LIVRNKKDGPCFLRSPQTPNYPLDERTSPLRQANFFTAELSLLKGSKDEAARLFRLAASDCPNDYASRFNAKAELKALGVAP
jgi:lipoprotein NlpI